MSEYNIYAAKTQLSRLVQQAVDGEEIIIAKSGKPLVKLVPVQPKKKKLKPRVFGKNFLGITYIAPDFYDDLPPEMFDGPIDPVDSRVLPKQNGNTENRKSRK